MRDSFYQKKYLVYPTASAAIHLEVHVYPHDIKTMGEREAVGHALWLSLWDNEKDQYGMPTAKPSPTSRVLRALCKQEGVENVKRKFVESITYKEVEDDHGSQQ